MAAPRPWALVCCLCAPHRLAWHHVFEGGLARNVEEPVASIDHDVQNEKHSEVEGGERVEQRETCGERHADRRAEEHESSATVTVCEDTADEGEGEGGHYANGADHARLRGAVGDHECDEGDCEVQQGGGKFFGCVAGEPCRILPHVPESNLGLFASHTPDRRRAIKIAQEAVRNCDC